jgi:succinate dehydrogenase / fumarate reductase cytochrome b subunit
MVGVGLLCLHLSHGASALWQSLGWKKRPYGPCLDRLAVGGAVLIFAGYIIIPISILLGWIK